MLSIQGSHNGHSAVIQVAIYDAAKYKEHKQSKQPMFRGATPFRTLIDTGATTTMISANVVAKHGMQPVGKIPFGSNHGIVRRRAYLFHVAFLASPFQQPIQEDHDADLDPEAVTTFVYTKEIHGGELPADTTFDVLLGMDVISTGDLTFRRDGTFRFDL